MIRQTNKKGTDTIANLSLKFAVLFAIASSSHHVEAASINAIAFSSFTSFDSNASIPNELAQSIGAYQRRASALLPNVVLVKKDLEVNDYGELEETKNTDSIELTLNSDLVPQKIFAHMKSEKKNAKIVFPDNTSTAVKFLWPNSKIIGSPKIPLILPNTRSLIAISKQSVIFVEKQTKFLRELSQIKKATPIEIDRLVAYDKLTGQRKVIFDPKNYRRLAIDKRYLITDVSCHQHAPRCYILTEKPEGVVQIDFEQSIFGKLSTKATWIYLKDVKELVASNDTDEIYLLQGNSKLGLYRWNQGTIETIRMFKKKNIRNLRLSGGYLSWIQGNKQDTTSMLLSLETSKIIDSIKWDLSRLGKEFKLKEVSFERRKST